MWGCFYRVHRDHRLRQVFPTHVGVFPVVCGKRCVRMRLPHACGGVSGDSPHNENQKGSSPRMWGCFLRIDGKKWPLGVFPTHVGVFPYCCRLLPRFPGLPHACGGVSRIKSASRKKYRSSPRMWGCFAAAPIFLQDDSVFPTHVGVFLFPTLNASKIGCLPHACGGVSIPGTVLNGLSRSSPRMWGCFCSGSSVSCHRAVFPTHVGVFPVRELLSIMNGSLPHACGGVSALRFFSVEAAKSSPRMWGCFLTGCLL